MLAARSICELTRVPLFELFGEHLQVATCTFAACWFSVDAKEAGDATHSPLCRPTALVMPSLDHLRDAVMLAATSLSSHCSPWFSCASILSVSLRHFQINLVELPLWLVALVCQVANLVRSYARLACSVPFDIRLWRPSGTMVSTTVTSCPVGSRTSRQRSASLVESGLV